jgi:hypothetical protein
MAKPGDGGVRALAGQHGFTAEKALMRGCWRLVDDDGNRIRNPLTGSTAFTVPELVAFLQGQKAF